MRRRPGRGHARASGATRPARAASATSSPGSPTTPSRRATTRRPAPRASTSTTTSPSWPASRRSAQHGLVALDWNNGNRSVLVDHELSGLIVGLTLGTRAEDVYRALIEATAFGTRKIIETFEASGRARARADRRRRPAQEPGDHADLRRRARGARCTSSTPSRAPRSGRRCTRRSPPGPTRTSTPPPARWARLRRDVYAPDEARADAYDALYEHYSTPARPLRARRRRRHARAAPHPPARGGPWLTSSPSCAARSARCTPSFRATGWWRGRAATSPRASPARSSWSSRPAACPTTSSRPRRSSSATWTAASSRATWRPPATPPPTATSTAT